MNIFNYLALAADLIASVSGIQSALTQNPVSGPALAQAVELPLTGLQAILPHVKIPAELITDITQAVADAINAFRKKA